MNHWLQQTARTQVRPPKRIGTKSARPPRPCKGRAREQVRATVAEQPVDVWFCAKDIFDAIYDDAVSCVDYTRAILLGMASRDELVAEFRAEVSPHAGQCKQRYNKWMFKREQAE